jgi:Transposase DDE domain
MRYIVDPQQNRPDNPFEGLFTPPAMRILAEGWQGLFRHVLLELLPVPKLAEYFHPTLGAPTKELYSMAGLVFLADFFGWTSQEAAQAYMFRIDVQYALNLEPPAFVAARTVERYQKLFRDDNLAAQIFHDITVALAKRLDLDISRQRLDSTHLLSHMATFGRTKLMAVAIKRFLTQAQRHALGLYSSLPEELRRRYEPAQARLVAGLKDADDRRRARQQVAEDLLRVIEHFADAPEITGRSSYKALRAIFDQQCEVVGDTVTVRAKTGGNCIQNPSDLDATYDGKKGPGYQVQIAETCVPENDVQLITAALPQTACETDDAALVPMLEQLKGSDLLPEELLTDTSYGSDDNVQAAAVAGVELIAPVPGRAPASDPESLTVDDFAVDERTGVVDACPAGHAPQSSTRDAETETTRVEMPPGWCEACPFRKQCPIQETADEVFVFEFSDKGRRLAGRRREQETEVFRQRYAARSGIESTNSGVKNRLGLGRLRVRGRGSMSRVILHKLAGWNVLRAATSKTLRAQVAQQVAQTLGTGVSGQTARSTRRLEGHDGHWRDDFLAAQRREGRRERLLAA